MHLLTPSRRHYVCLRASVTPHCLLRWFLAWPGRFDEDVSPTRYRANTPRRLHEVASQSGFRLVGLELFEAAPAYLCWSWPTFLMGVACERAVNRFGLVTSAWSSQENPSTTKGELPK